MSENQPIDKIKSTPCMEMPSILDASDHSLDSFKSFNGDDDKKIDKKTKFNSNVKTLIEKHNSFHEKSLDAKIINFNVKKKNFSNACEKLNTSYTDCMKISMNMEGDSKPVENVENFVRIKKFYD